MSGQGVENTRKVSVIEDVDGNKIVMVNDILFKGKRHISWDEVEAYLKRYIGSVYEIEETGEAVFLGVKFPAEFTGSIYTKKLKGTIAKAKANIAQGIPELVAHATKRKYEKNRKDKHKGDAKFGWYRYEVRFGIPVYYESGEIERYNIFHARLLVRHSANGKRYLYDVTEIKKETSTSCQA